MTEFFITLSMQYILIFSSSAFKLYNLFRFPFTNFSHYPAGIVSSSSWQNWWNWVRSEGLLAHPRPFSSALKFPVRLRSELCDGRSKTLTLLSFSHFDTNVAATGNHCPSEDPFVSKLSLPGCCLEKVLQLFFIIVFFHENIDFVTCTSLSCSQAPPTS